VTSAERLLRELIALPSVNPAFLPSQSRTDGEMRVAKFLATTAARVGLEVEFKSVLPGRANLLAHLRPRDKTRQRVVLAPHLDTVGAEEAQFKPRVSHGRLFGRGACDTKGSIAVMMTAICELARSSQRPSKTEIVFAGLVDEENAQAGARSLASSGFKADLAIVGEPTREQVVTAHKGSLWFELQTHGKSAHGARPELGRNAVHTMARVVHLLETRYAAELRRWRHPLLGCATVSVGAIHGGTQANIVPDRCSILVDRRTLPGETEAGVRREIQSFLRKRQLEVTFSNGRMAPCYPLETDPNRPLVSQFLRSAGQRAPVGVHYFCDASVLARAGIPSVVFGPGDIAQAHTADEWVALSSLERARRKLLSFLRSLA
jgi:acetylornithine deacetylase/succinyl-diaminopimelate desuccinylase-like protein